MNRTSIPVQFEHKGLAYNGWATPSEQLYDDGEPKSYHVVLNMVMFGNLSLNLGKWLSDQQRPPELVVEVGKTLDHHLLPMFSA
jgi:hypothetical protein